MIVTTAATAATVMTASRSVAHATAIVLRPQATPTTNQRRVATLEERADLALEIDATLAASLAALCIQLEATHTLLEGHDLYRGLVLLEQAHRIAVQGLHDSRRAIRTLRGGGSGVNGEISDLIMTHHNSNDALIEFIVEGEPTALSAPATVALLRTVDEALAHARKHAPSHPARVRLCYAEREVSVTVSNSVEALEAGCPLSPRTISDLQDGYGLASVRERLLSVNGSMTVALDHRHWTVIAQVPR
jgi:signal transduction histidine kinase